jgi:hypothetical protein
VIWPPCQSNDDTCAIATIKTVGLHAQGFLILAIRSWLFWKRHLKPQYPTDLAVGVSRRPEPLLLISHIIVDIIAFLC